MDTRCSVPPTPRGPARFRARREHVDCKDFHRRLEKHRRSSAVDPTDGRSFARALCFLPRPQFASSVPDEVSRSDSWWFHLPQLTVLALKSISLNLFCTLHQNYLEQVSKTPLSVFPHACRYLLSSSPFLDGFLCLTCTRLTSTPPSPKTAAALSPRRRSKASELSITPCALKLMPCWVSLLQEDGGI